MEGSERQEGNGKEGKRNKEKKEGKEGEGTAWAPAGFFLGVDKLWVETKVPKWGPEMDSRWGQAPIS